MLILTQRRVSGLASVLPLHLSERGAVIGSGPPADLVLPDPQGTVGLHHAQIDWHDGHYWVRAAAPNTVHVNGWPIGGAHRLTSGDTIGVGPFVIDVALASVVAASRPRGMNLENWSRDRIMVPATLAAQDVSPDFPSTTAAQILPSVGASDDAVTQLLAAARVPRSAVALDDAAVLAAAGALLRQLTAGVIAMLASREQARRELGVKPPVNSGGPLQTAATAEAAVALLLASPVSDRIVSAALLEVDRHQRAALYAMQGALRATLDRLSPDAIRDRAGSDAARWRAYEAAFAGTGEDEAFIEVFARELAAAYVQVGN